MTRKLWARVGLLLTMGGALGACETRVDVSSSSNVNPEYAHVFLTVQAVWFNVSATAGPDDAGWVQNTLSTPATVDLATDSNGALTTFASEIKVPSATYAQVRLFLTDPAATLTASALAAGAIYNDEVDYFDSTGTEHQVPLQLNNPEKGIGIAGTFTVASATTAALGALGGAQNSTASTTTSTSPFATTPTTTTATGVTTTTPTLGTTTTTPTLGTTTTVTPTLGTTDTTDTTDTTGTTSTTIAGSYAIDFDASRDLVPFDYSGQQGYLLNPNLTAYDLSNAGTIASQIDIGTLTTSAVSVATNDEPNIEVSAETPNAAGTANVVVKSTPVNSDGTFVLYPLSTASGAPSQYDLVFHGPGVTTVIVKAVPVASGAPTSSATVLLTGITLVAANTITVNLPAANPLTPPGSLVGFYQTISGGAGEIPYLVEQYPIDPITGMFDSNESLSAGTLEYGTYVADQTTQALSTATPAEGAATYRVGATAFNYTNSPLTTTVKGAAAGSTAPADFTLAKLAILPTAVATTINGTVAVSSPGKYTNGELIISHEGVIVAAMPLGAMLDQASSTLSFTGVPGGSTSTTFPTGVYYAEAWVWNASNPTGTFSRQPYGSVIDLSAGGASGVAISID